ncbi:hypothetical protein [Pseudacidovorax intermedius]|uniref:hypothetical protein n=1 Tax=Pseudacidovorax intermedius TaxID=433924 RepID=UPI00128EF92C|nr:hypothetical protein [Pseudacidovorax intermedius]
MFESVVLRKNALGAPLSPGLIAEALLFYKKTHIVFDKQTIVHLAMVLGNDLLTILKRPDVTAVYLEELLSTATRKAGVIEFHDFGLLLLTGTQAGGPINTSEERLVLDLKRAGMDADAAKKYAMQFLRLVPVRRLESDHFAQGGLSKVFRSYFDDESFMSAALRRIVNAVPGGYELGEHFRVEILRGESGHHVFHQIDLDRINAVRRKLSPPVSDLTTALLLTMFLESASDIALAAHYGSDFITSGASSAILSLRYSDILKRLHRNQDELDAFAEVVHPGMPNLAEVIDSGQQSFKSYLVLLDKSAKFREWIHGANPDAGLVKEYFDSIAAEHWIQTGKAKVARYMLGLIADSLHPVLGNVYSFADTFMVEKIAKGWRPNHFIDKKLTPFLSRA